MRALAAPRFAKAVERMATIVDTHRNYRVLRRIEPMNRAGWLSLRGETLIGCAIDVETTGLDNRQDSIIELALQKFWADAAGNIIIAGRGHSWLEDPGSAITPEITALTGIRSADVRGRRIMDPIASSLIADADFVVAHNAGFDRPFVEKRLPDAAGRPWICSMKDVDWRGFGFEGRTLSHLLSQMGWFYDPHRASTDVTALLHLLDHRLSPFGTALRHAVDAGRTPSCLVEAVGAAFETKDVLKARGYRWNPAKKLWSKEIRLDAKPEEQAWAVRYIYAGSGAPRFRPLTWVERYADC